MNLANTTVDPTGKNETLANDVIADSFDFKNNPGLVFLTIACGFTGIWILFVTFYNSRLLAFIVTKLLRKFYFKDGHLEIGNIFMVFYSILSSANLPTSHTVACVTAIIKRSGNKFPLLYIYNWLHFYPF